MHWLDIVGEAGWQTFDQLHASQLGRMISRGWLYSTDKGVTRIFSDYIKSKDQPTFEDIGSTTIIPTSVIVSIKKLLN